MKKINLVKKESHGINHEVSTFLVGANVELQVLHTKNSNVAQSWDYPIKPNGLCTDGAEDVLNFFDFSQNDSES